LFADEMSKMPYKEYHRGRYKGVWFSEGLYELLFDIQVRSNEIGNQIARGLEWAAKTVFSSPDKLVVQNVLTDLKNGDIIRTAGLTQVSVRMQGLDQLIAEFNRLMMMANSIANSMEVVQGITPSSGTPLGTTQLLNQNAGKLFDFIREKFEIPFREIFEEWIIPELLEDMKAQDVLRLTGDPQMLQRLNEAIVNDWYIRNLIAIGPHSQDVAETLKLKKMEEMDNKTVFLTNFKEMLDEYKPRVSVIITGENSNIPSQIEAYSAFIGLEADPIRRSALIEKAMMLKGVDVGSLPKTETPQPEAPRPTQPNAQIPEPTPV